MINTRLIRRTVSSRQIAALLLLAGGALFAAPPRFLSTNSVSDILGAAHETDPILVNPWGLVPGPEGNLHVADNGAGYASLYAPDGSLISGSNGVHAITIPQAAVTTGTLGLPTGVDANYVGIFDKHSDGFVITSGSVSGPAHYLYATEDGAIVGQRESVDETSGVVAADESGAGAGYTGLALSFVTGSDGRLHHQAYAANFRQGRIDVFDKDFNLLRLTGSNNFADPAPPALPADAPAGSFWSPFNVKNVDYHGLTAAGNLGVVHRIVVLYALNSGSAAPLDDVPGPGHGYVNTFAPDGTFLKQLIPPGGALNSPWGLAVAHVPVGGLPNAVFLVGNHGDGQINAYAFTPGDPAINGLHLGTLVKDLHGTPLAFDGLWDLHFGPKPINVASYLLNPALLGEDDTNLYFSAGLLGETHGIVGRIVIP